MKTLLQAGALAALTISPSFAQHRQVTAVRPDPVDAGRVWTCNRDNNSVSVMEPGGVGLVEEIRVGVMPRSLDFSADGSKVFVTCQRGGIFKQRNFVTGFDPSDVRAAVLVIDRATRLVSSALTNVGVEPYGVATAPNGEYFVVSGMRSGTIKLFDADTHAELATHQYLNNLNFIPDPFTIADVDSDRDGVADFQDPRGFVISDDSSKIFVTHHKSPWISVLQVGLDPMGNPTGIAQVGQLNTDEYAPHPIWNPVPVQTLESQGDPRFLEDIALSPDGSRALIPHLLHNVNHDVNFDFTTILPSFAGDFANRVYPALTMIDTAVEGEKLGPANPIVTRLHHELTDPLVPSEFVPFGETVLRDGPLSLGATGDPVVGGTANFVLDGFLPGDNVILMLGTSPANMDMGASGTVYVNVRRPFTMVNGEVTWTIPNIPQLDGQLVYAQALVQDTSTMEVFFSNAVRIPVSTESHGTNEMGHRAGHPSRVLYNATGDHVIMLNRGSEDVFLYEANGDDLRLRTVFPPRHEFVERGALVEDTPMGDIPMGMALVPDASTPADDALLYVINEGTRTLSTLRVNFTTGVISDEFGQVKTILGDDIMSFSARIGLELFEDASRPQTTGNFNNSCASCHFEGGEDANVWQRPDGPRSTMPVYGGSLGTGLVLWRGNRLSMAETGPMFGGENGGHGIFTEQEQQGLIDYHETIPFPMNPNLASDSSYSTLAEMGKDLYFGTNDSGTNPMGRSANCAECHPDNETDPTGFPGPRFYTADFLNPLLTSSDNLGQVIDVDGVPTDIDSNCFTLRENIVTGIRDVNTEVDTDMSVDRNSDGYLDFDNYAAMNLDTVSDFKRDDPNSYLCPCDTGVGDPNCDTDGFRIFRRLPGKFSIPTKLGAWGTAPYFHDHSAYSLRTLLDPAGQANDPKYGNPAFGVGAPEYPRLEKLFNDVHDIKGHEEFVFGVSKVQGTLLSGSAAQAAMDTEAILAYIQSL